MDLKLRITQFLFLVLVLAFGRSECLVDMIGDGVFDPECMSESYHVYIDYFRLLVIRIRN